MIRRWGGEAEQKKYVRGRAWRRNRKKCMNILYKMYQKESLQNEKCSGLYSDRSADLMGYLTKS